LDCKKGTISWFRNGIKVPAVLKDNFAPWDHNPDHIRSHPLYPAITIHWGTETVTMSKISGKPKKKNGVIILDD